MHQYKEELIDVSQMLLDPNNFRFQNAPDFVFADPKRFAEASGNPRHSNGFEPRRFCL